jgi:hypothetical protein
MKEEEGRRRNAGGMKEDECRKKEGEGNRGAFCAPDILYCNPKASLNAHEEQTFLASTFVFVWYYNSVVNEFLCTGGAYYVTYSFRFISNKSWDGGEGRGSFT